LRSEQPFDIDVAYVTTDGAERILGRIATGGGPWIEQSFALDGGSIVASSLRIDAATVSGRQGSGRGVAIAFDLVGPDGKTTFNLDHGRRATFAFDYRINDPNLDERCQVVFAFKRNGVDDVVRTISRDMRFNGASSREGRIEMTLDPVR